MLEKQVEIQANSRFYDKQLFILNEIYKLWDITCMHAVAANQALPSRIITIPLLACVSNNNS